MKEKFITDNSFNEKDLIEQINDEIINQLLNEYTMMESPIIYFSAGDAKIKEILIRKDPIFSV